MCFSCSHNDHFENGRCVPNSGPVICRGGSHLENGICVSNERPSPQQKRSCPAGYKVLDKPNKYGAYCEPPAPTAKCPPSAPEGTPPNCHCPAGTVSREGFCRPATCGPNMTGVPPNCHRVCPAGTVNQNELCVPISKPGKVGPAPKPVPTPPKSSGDKVLINGVCRCPSSAPKDIGHNRCD